MLVSVFHIKKKDLVQVISGKDRGKTGKILKVNQKKGKVTVEKVNMIKRHTRGTGKEPGGIIEKEGALFASKVLLYCDKCAKGVRIFKRRSESNPKKSVRFCSQCETQIDK